MSDDAHWEAVQESGEQSDNRLWPLLDAVWDMHSFLEFLSALADDAEEADRKEAAKPAGSMLGWNGWENGSIAAFLESAVAWARANKRIEVAFPDDENPWKASARIIYAGKYYE
jgi:hypothetical protein